MAKGGHRRPVNRKKPFKKDSKKEDNNTRRAKGKKKQVNKNKDIVRQMRGVKWDEEEYSDDIDELDETE